MQARHQCSACVPASLWRQQVIAGTAKMRLALPARFQGGLWSAKPPPQLSAHAAAAAELSSGEDLETYQHHIGSFNGAPGGAWGGSEVQPAAASMVQVVALGEDGMPLDEKEQLRRSRISNANSGKTPWNKGRKHSPGAQSGKLLQEGLATATARSPAQMSSVKLACCRPTPAETIAKIRARTREAMQRPDVREAYKEGVAKHLRKHSDETKVGRDYEKPVAHELGWHAPGIRRQPLVQNPHNQAHNLSLGGPIAPHIPWVAKQFARRGWARILSLFHF